MGKTPTDMGGRPRQTRSVICGILRVKLRPEGPIGEFLSRRVPRADRRPARLAICGYRAVLVGHYLCVRYPVSPIPQKPSCGGLSSAI